MKEESKPFYVNTDVTLEGDDTMIITATVRESESNMCIASANYVGSMEADLCDEQAYYALENEVIAVALERARLFAQVALDPEQSSFLKATLPSEITREKELFPSNDRRVGKRQGTDGHECTGDLHCKRCRAEYDDPQEFGRVEPLEVEDE